MDVQPGLINGLITVRESGIAPGVEEVAPTEGERAGDSAPGAAPPRAAPPRATFRDVFGVAEFRALWLAQLQSVAGDQLARVALTVLVYDRTRSALLAAVTFAASVVPMFVGGVTLSGLADRLPRRQVMIVTALGGGGLVAVMALPGLPVAVLVVLLFAVTMMAAPFSAARAAVYPEILEGDQYPLGTVVTLTTSQFAQVLGFAAGGVTVAFLGVRVSLLADAVTFGVAALIIRIRIRARPAARSAPDSPAADPAADPAKPRPARAGPLADMAEGWRLVFRSPAMRTAMLFGWLAAFYNLPEGVATPLAHQVGGGAATVGLILAAQATGEAVGAIGFSRLVDPKRRLRLMTPLAVVCCGVLGLFATGPRLAGVLAILAVSGVFGCYQIAANASFVQATPPQQRSQAFGLAQGGISLGQGTAFIVAGAAAQHVAPATVIAVAGGLGALCALAIGITRPRASGAGPARPPRSRLPGRRSAGSHRGPRARRRVRRPDRTGR
jgi:MFS family permease